MLPSINAQQWCVLPNDRILVCVCADLDDAGLVVLDEPGPAATLDTSKSCVELGLELGEITVG